MSTTEPRPTIKLSSSLRTRSAEESVPIAAAIGRSRGVIRVVDTTWLDKIGIPVYASIRPDAHKDSLCVHAGKGFTHAEAKIGAFMEAIEFSFSPPGRSALTFQEVSPLQIVQSFGGRISFLDFCPRLECRLDSNDRIAAVVGDEIRAGLGRVLIPAELVYCPFPGNPGKQVYGTSTNGLASGNTLEEATVHGLSEVIERDVTSFDILGAPSQLVVPSSLPPKVAEMVDRVERAGLGCCLRYSPNPFAAPYFCAYVIEPEATQYGTVTMASGMGLHPNSDIAAVRALAEAVQSRLTTIHGGRDDLISKHELSGKLGLDHALRHQQRTRSAVVDASSAIRFDEIPSANAETIEQAQAALFASLEAGGLQHVVRVVYTEPDYPFQVVRIVVPGAEFYEHALQRVGPRLLNFFKTSRPQTMS